MSNLEFDALPLSYPKERHAGIEPATCGLRRRSPVEPMSPCRNTAFRLGHTPRQCRAHRTGCEPVPLETVRSMCRIAGRRRPAIRVPMRIPPSPAPSIAVQRFRASWRNSATATTRARTSMSVRSRCDAAEMHWMETRERNRSRRERSRACRMTLFADAETETPPEMVPRAFAVLGDRGNRSP